MFLAWSLDLDPALLGEFLFSVPIHRPLDDKELQYYVD